MSTLQTIEMMHKDVQEACNKACGMVALAIQMARILGSKISTADAAELQDSPELIEWADKYRAVSAIAFKEAFHESSARSLRRAVRLLDIMPS